MTIELRADARARLDQHLDEVEKALVEAGRSREQRRGVVDDLEAQILDMLAKRSEAPTLAEVNEVLKGLDPPAAYVDAPGTAAPAPSPGVLAAPRYSGLAIAGFVCILLSLIPLGVAMVVALYTAKAAPREAVGVKVPIAQYERDPVSGNWRQNVVEMAPDPGGRGAAPAPSAEYSMGGLLCVIIPVGPLALAGTVLGWIAFVGIRKSNGMVKGMGLALFDGLFYPVLTPFMVLFLA